MLRRRSPPTRNGLTAEVDRIAELTEEFRRTLDGIREGKDGLKELHRAAKLGLDAQRRQVDELVDRSRTALEWTEREQRDTGARVTALESTLQQVQQQAEQTEQKSADGLEEIRERTRSALDRISASIEQWSTSSQQHSQRIDGLERWTHDTTQTLSGLVAHRAHSLERLEQLESALAQTRSESQSQLDAQSRRLRFLVVATLALAVLLGVVWGTR